MQVELQGLEFERERGHIYNVTNAMMRHEFPPSCVSALSFQSLPTLYLHLKVDISFSHFESTTSIQSILFIVTEA